MIHNLCNLVSDSNLDTFYKILIAEASQLPAFDHLTPKADVLGIINSLPNTFQAMVLPFLPEKHTLAAAAKLVNDNTQWNNSISFPLVPQDEAIQALLETFNNKEVVAFLVRISHSHLYGTQAQPLLFSYSELHAPTKTGLKGYNVTMQGDGYGAPMYFAGSESSFPVIKRGLAFELAGSL